MRILLALVVVSFFQPALARQSADSPFILNLDYARFRYDDKTAYLEIYYAFYTQLVTLVPSEKGFRGEVYLDLKLTRQQNDSAVVDQAVIIPVSVADTTSQSLRSTFVNQTGYSVPFGDYNLHVLAYDRLNPSRRDSIRLPIQFRPYPSTPAMSDLELCSTVKASQEKSSHFFKNGLEVVPNPTLTFGVTATPVLFNYLELYNLKPNVPYALTTVVLDASDKVVREATKTKTFTIASAVEAGTMNVTSYPSGKYRYRLILSEGGTEVARTEKVFYIYNPHIPIASPSATALKANELSGMSADELAEEFRRGQYMATDQEIKTFSQITNEEGRRTFLAQFWNEVEKGRMGRQPISRADYMQRLQVANQRYKSFSREGWQTDRGRVLILYGDPDEVERAPSREDAKPYEIWRYFNIENGVEFVFVDRTGFGDYQLVHSTKRGELRDDTWSRYLR
ncbi:MAG TPA: GWxTD domain-containing protein [Bacteroidota bacterium]|nr:GWxTD domain-containing protein [Bacteroidota bacterium]